MKNIRTNTEIRTSQRAAVFDAGMDRRAFMGRLGLVAGAGVAAYTVPGVFSIPRAEAATAVEAPTAKPVVSVFMDMPWVDMSGRAEPYVPPREMKLSAKLSLAEDFGNYHYYV